MITILETLLNPNKKIYIALTAIYGIGKKTSQKILKILNINPYFKTSELSEKNLFEIRNYLEENNYKLPNELKSLIKLNIQHLININSYKGQRHLKGLPVHGQRTRTNSKTSKKLKILN